MSTCGMVKDMLTGRIQRIGSLGEMQDFAAHFLDDLPGGAIVLLYGELGGGKTTFVQGVAKALGVVEDVTSPTFTIAGEYNIPNHPTFKQLLHADLYRFKDDEAQKDAMVQDMLNSASAEGRLTMIEWADRLGENIPQPAWKLVFSHGTQEGQRIVDATHLQPQA